MRIAYVGNFIPGYSTENDVRLAFESLGHQVVKLQENQIDASTLMREALASDLLLWTSTWDCIDLGDALDVFHACAPRGIPTATLHLDTFWPTSRGNRKWWREPMFHTAHVFTADGDHEDKWKALGVNHHWLRPAVRHTAAHLGSFRSEYECDVAFVGSNGVGYHEDCWLYRKELVDQLRAMCARNGWTWRNPGGDDPKVSRGDMNDFYASAKVTVGDSLCLNYETARYWSDRAYEAPGRGGFLIMPRIDALADDYAVVGAQGMDVSVSSPLPMYEWGDWRGLEGIVSEFLADDERREKTRLACHEIAAARHTYVNRMQEMLSSLGFTRKAA